MSKPASTHPLPQILLSWRQAKMPFDHKPGPFLNEKRGVCGGKKKKKKAKDAEGNAESLRDA